ncbi:MAG: HEAT repeat domain-containing protein, partial [Candidatus Sericytochromatia bacterium]
VEQLSRHAVAAMPLMLEALVTAEEEIRKNLAWVLGFLRRPEAYKPLLHVLSSDSSLDVRQSASWALRQMDLAQLAALIFTKLPAPQNLEEIRNYLLSKSWKARWFCTVLLTFEQAPECLEALMQLAQSDEKTVVRCSAILTLAAYDDQRIPALLCQLLHDIDDHVKIEAATVLSLKHYRPAVPELAKQLRAYNENVRVSVVSALGALGDPAAIPHLAAALKDPADLVRINAAMALYDLAQGLKRRHATIRDLCIKALRDNNVYVVKNAARTLGLVGDEDSLRQIIALLKQETRPGILSNLIQALGMMQDARAVKVLGKLLRHESWEVRFEVMRSLGLLRGAANEVYPLLVQGLKDPAVMVKEQAIHALGRLGNKRAIPHLEKLKLQHPYGVVNKTIAKALDRLLEI